MNPPNLFDQLRDVKLRVPYEQAKVLTKVQHALLEAEDLIGAILKLELPACEFMENKTLKNLFAASSKLEKLFELNQ